MILNSLCNSCFQPYQVLVQPSDMELVKQVADEDGQTCPCPRLCGGRINLVGDPVISQMAADRRLKAPVHLTGRELYQAINGMGLPDELEKDPLVIKAMLTAHRVVSTDVALFREKVYLNEIHLDNGATIHLGAGPRGAEVVKVTKRRDDGSPSSG